MDELEHFAYLNLDDENDMAEKVVGHGQVGSRTREVIIPNDEESYEKVCLERWPNSVEEKRILDKRHRTVHTWERFYKAMDDSTERFARRRVYEQRREFGVKSLTPATSSKRQKSARDQNALPSRYSIIAVAASAEYAIVLVRDGDDVDKAPGGRLWSMSTSNYPTSNWRRSDIVVEEFQAGYTIGDVLYIVSNMSIDVYKLPGVELVYRLNVWETQRVLLKGCTNVIRASPHLVVVVTSQRGFMVWQIIDKALQPLHYENPNIVDGGPQFQYTTAAIYLDTIAMGRTDGLVEIWKLTQNEDGNKLQLVSTDDWFQAVNATDTGRLITPTQGKPINCLEMSGAKLAISTETDLIQVNRSEYNRSFCPLVDVATPASLCIFGDLLVVMTRDGGFSVAEFGSGLTYCNTARSIEDALEDCVVGQQWVFVGGDLAGGLWPNGNLNVLSHNSMKH
jgi:hypothetical protein